MTVNVPYTPPALKLNGFNCPLCHAFAKQDWGQAIRLAGGQNCGQDDWLLTCRCSRCGKFSVWVEQKMLFPHAVTAPPPNSDLPEDVRKDFDEARIVVAQSPRGAAALLRLAIQKLCKHLGEAGENINADIASLVKKGLPAKVQQAMDIVRVVGNNAVHPGQIDIRDDADTATRLFGLINLVADVMITQPKHVESLYQNIVPESARQAIAKRDGT